MNGNITIEQAIEQINYYKTEYMLLSSYVKHLRKEITKLKKEATEKDNIINQLKNNEQVQQKLF